MDLNVQFYKMSKQMKTQLYLDNLTTIFNPQALFADGTEFYRCPSEPDPYDRVRLRLRCARENLDSVILIFNDERIEMEKLYNDRMFDYYETFVQLGTEQVFYYFEIHCGQMVCYYNNVGLCNSVEEYYNFTMTPGFHTPDWAKGAVFYQIYVDRFYNGDRSNDVEDNEYIYIGEGTSKVTDWNKYPAAMGVREFYGGDIAGVMQKLDYLQELGVEVIYLNPVFVSPSNHKYDIQDYDYIDPHFGRIVKDEGELLQKDEHGNWKADANYPNKDASRYICRVTDKENLEASNRLFAEFVEEVHRRGMKVILDGVFNHCGSFNKWLDRERLYEEAEGFEKGAYVSADSPYRNYFRFQDEQGWPCNGSYEGWWGYENHPKLNVEGCAALREELLAIARRWVSPPFDADGWRLDVADELPDDFIAGLNAAAKQEKPDALVIGEVWEDASNKIAYSERRRYFGGGELDSVMNYPLRDAILAYLNGGTAEHFAETMETLRENYPRDVFYNLMNIIGTHDTARALTVLGVMSEDWKKSRDERAHYELPPDRLETAKRRLRLAAVIQFTMPGSPTIYYGDEAGRQGFEDPFNRRTYPWGAEDREILAFYRRLCEVRADSETLIRGELRFDTGENDALLRYERTLGRSRIIILVNRSRQEVKTNVNALYALDLLSGEGFAYADPDGLVVSVPPETAYILRCVNAAD